MPVWWLNFRLNQKSKNLWIPVSCFLLVFLLYIMVMSICIGCALQVWKICYKLLILDDKIALKGPLKHFILHNHSHLLFFKVILNYFSCGKWNLLLNPFSLGPFPVGCLKKPYKIHNGIRMRRWYNFWSRCCQKLLKECRMFWRRNFTLFGITTLAMWLLNIPCVNIQFFCI